MLGTKIIEEIESEVNGKVQVVRSLGFGTYIQVAGLTQSGGVVGSIWQTTLRRISHAKKDKVENCLILGLGGGTAAKLIGKYYPDAKITGVEIDPIMICLGKKYLGLRNVETIIQDAEEFVKRNNKAYDLVIVDLYIGDKFPKKFEKSEFLGKLTRSKLVIFNRLYFKGKREEADGFGEKLKRYFGKVERFYPQANLMLICRP